MLVLETSDKSWCDFISELKRKYIWSSSIFQKKMKINEINEMLHYMKITNFLYIWLKINIGRIISLWESGLEAFHTLLWHQLSYSHFFLVRHTPMANWQFPISFCNDFPSNHYTNLYSFVFLFLLCFDWSYFRTRFCSSNPCHTCQ